MKIAVILGTNCDNQISERLAHWVAFEAGDRDETEVELIDLKEYSLTFSDESERPCDKQSRRISKTAQEWLDKIEKADAYVFVTPEHDHSIPSLLKAAFDQVTREMSEKPAAIVSYGSFGGTRTVKYLEDIIRKTQAVPIPAHVAISGAKDKRNEDENIDTEVYNQLFDSQFKMRNMLSELSLYRDALTAAGAYA